MATKNSQDYTYHCAALRLRVDGTGNLQLKLIGPNDVRQNVLVPLTMVTLDSQTRDKLANFRSESIQLEFKTTEIDEIFSISKITFFTKPVATSP